VPNMNTAKIHFENRPIIISVIPTRV